MSLTNFNLCCPDHSITSLNQSNNQSQFPTMPLHYIISSYYYIANLHLNCDTSNLLGPLFCQTGNIFLIPQVSKRLNNFLNRTFSLTQIFLVNTYNKTSSLTKCKLWRFSWQLQVNTFNTHHDNHNRTAYHLKHAQPQTMLLTILYKTTFHHFITFFKHLFTSPTKRLQ